MKSLIDAFYRTITAKEELSRIIAESPAELPLTFDMANYCDRLDFMSKTFRPIVDKAQAEAFEVAA